MKRRYITCKENVSNGAYNIVLTKEVMTNTNVREASIVDEFYTQVEKQADGEESITYTDPIIMLFNQQRLDSLGSSALDAWLKTMSVTKNNPLAELRKKCSDEDLIQLIKSRYLQQPSEIMAWAKYMQDNMEEFSENVRNLVAKKQASEEYSKQLNVEPTKSE